MKTSLQPTTADSVSPTKAAKKISTPNKSNNLSSFHVLIIGQIESASFPSTIDGLYCRFSFVSGLDWEIIHGVDRGITQTAKKTNRAQSVITWNFPIDISYGSTNIHGWPRICFSVNGLDWLGRDIVRGYGCLMCPIMAGNHIEYVHLYVPESSSPWNRFLHFLTGSPPEYYDSRFVSRADGRGATRVKCQGTIKVVLNIATKGIENSGYDVGTN